MVYNRSNTSLKTLGIRLVSLLLVFFVLGGVVARAAADPLPNSEIQALNEWPNWVPTSGGSCAAATTAVALSGNDNPSKIWNFFVSKGLSGPQIAGVMGNLQQESGFDPTKIQGGGDSQDPGAAGSGGWGLAQWTPGSKITGIEQQYNISGPVYDLGVQLQIIWAEMTNTSPNGSQNIVAGLKQINDAAQAAIYFDAKFEGGTDPNGIRETNAINLLAKYGGTSGGNNATLVSAITGGDCGGAAGPGQNTKYLDGFTFYDQCDPVWGKISYGSGGGTICSSGCGPSSMAMIITTLTGTTVTPDVTAAYAVSNNLYVPNVGTSWSVAPVEAQHWGLKATPLANNIGQISSAIQAGALVIVAGNGPEPFTSAGHFIVIRAVTADGKWMIGDPDGAHVNANTTPWDPAQLLVSMNSGSAYAISK